MSSGAPIRHFAVISCEVVVEVVTSLERLLTPLAPPFNDGVLIAIHRIQARTSFHVMVSRPAVLSEIGVGPTEMGVASSGGRYAAL